jgi:hypothetical protein
MLFRETVAVYCENHTKHTNTFSGHNAEFWFVKAGGVSKLNGKTSGTDSSYRDKKKSV